MNSRQNTVKALIDDLRTAGLTITVIDGGMLHVAPKSAITPALLEAIKANKPALIERLGQVEDERKVVRVVKSCEIYPGSKNTGGVTSNTRPPKRHPFSVHAAWRTADRIYLYHHAHCAQCKTAGRRLGNRCDTGAGLWRDCINAFANWSAP